MATTLQKISWGILRITKTGYSVRKNKIECTYHQPLPDSPLLFFANHAHVGDPFFAGYFLKEPVSYVSNVDGISFAQKFGSLLVGIIPKKKGQPDFQSLKNTIATIKDGHSVGIFPEGDRTWTGETAPIIGTTGSLVKKLNVPIVIGHFSGNYLSNPRWATYKRKGKIFLDLYSYSAEELKEMSKEEINNLISEKIYNNDIKNPRLKDYEYKCKEPAAGVEHLLWMCPECGEEDSIYGKGNEIICRSCGKKWTLNDHLGIKPDFKEGEDLKDWDDWQKRKISEQIAGENKLLSQSKNLTIGRRKEGELFWGEKGDLKLYRDSIVFEPYNSNNKKIFEIKKIKFYVDNFNQSFEFTYNEERIAFNFDGKNSYKWLLFIEELQS